MLVLSRDVGEKIVIGEGDLAVVVTILEVTANRVKIGVDAPKDINIARPESPKPPRLNQ